MPRLTKGALAAKAREAVKRQIRQSAAALLVPPVASVPKPEAQNNPELSVEGGPSFPLEPTIEIDIKQELVFTGVENQLLQQGEVEVKEELLDPGNPGLVDGEQDPIGQDGCRLLLQSKEENEPDNRCQFCLKLFQESGGRGIITKMKIEFVLGLRKWGGPGRRPDCCEGCRRMFDMFYEFKQSCLLALARPAELFICAGNKGLGQFVDLKPNIRKKPKSMGRKAVRIKKSKTKISQKMEDFHGFGVSSKQESLEPEAVSTEALSAELQQDVKEAECAICNEKFSDRSALRQHLLKHYPTESNESATKRSGPVKREKKTYCGRCRKWFSVKSVYWQHKPSCVETHELNKRPPPEFACSLCPKKFLRQQELTYHIDMHNGVRTIPCRREGCSKMFYHPNVRLNHEKLCGQEVQEICSICGSIFRSKSALGVHLATHGDPKFMCELCNKGFYSKANLKKHATVHSDERKFQCKVCGKRFKSHEANRVHQRIHTEEKPYVCHICGQRFTYNCLLKTHLEKGHETVPGLLAPSTEAFPSNPFGGLGF
ncbi:zinc finger protein 271-like [Ochlerotatus camptorhynchus]|uniref:zinc finger protein 271-like n=1 Tax=Ochlerotatus camptorhynchus TaxID=644619 RepID=UPI0031D03351